MKKIILIILLFSSCKYRSNIQTGNQFYNKGEYDINGMETGIWKYFNSDGKLIEEGRFEDGLRLGKWKYYEPVYDSITWKSYSSNSSSIITNVPTFLILKEQDSQIVKFASADSLKLFNLVIGKNYSLVSFSSYKTMLLDDLLKYNVAL
jgi:hypothetical protein